MLNAELLSGIFIAGGLLVFAGAIWIVIPHGGRRLMKPDTLKTILVGVILFSVVFKWALETSWIVPMLALGALVAVIVLDRHYRLKTEIN